MQNCFVIEVVFRKEQTSLSKDRGLLETYSRVMVLAYSSLTKSSTDLALRFPFLAFSDIPH